MALKSDVRDDSVTRDNLAAVYQQQWQHSLHAVQEATLQIIGPAESDDAASVTSSTTGISGENANGEVMLVRTDKVHLFAYRLEKEMDVVALQNKSCVCPTFVTK